MDYHSNAEQNNDFPVYDRRRIRHKAKKKAFSVIKEHKGLVFLAALLAWLPSILVGVITEWQSVENTFQAINSAQKDTLMAATSSVGNTGGTILLDFLTIFALVPLSMGLYHLFTILLRGQGVPSVNTIFSRFQSGKQYWLSVKLSVLLFFYAIFWSIPVMAIGMAPFFVLLRYGRTLGAFGSLICLILGVVLTFFMILFYAAKIQSYKASFLLSLDYEENRARDMIFGTKILYGGHLSELMVFLLSFVGWYVPPVAVGTGLVTLAYMDGMIGKSVTFTFAMAILVAVAAIVMLVYCLFVVAYQTMAFICLTEELRARNGDKAAVPLEKPEASDKTE